jgi:hypothetical protein
MVGRGHTKETVGLLNVNSIHLNTLFDGRSLHLTTPQLLWYDHDLPSKRVFKCIDLHLRTRRFLWYDQDLPSKRVFKCIEFTFNNPTVSFV